MYKRALRSASDIVWCFSESPESEDEVDVSEGGCEGGPIRSFERSAANSIGVAGPAFGSPIGKLAADRFEGLSVKKSTLGMKGAHAVV